MSREERVHLQRPLPLPLPLSILLSLPYCGLSSKHMRMSRHDVQNKILNKTQSGEQKKVREVCYLLSAMVYINLVHLRDVKLNRRRLIRYEVCHSLLQWRPVWCTQRGFMRSVDKLLRHCVALRLFCAVRWMGEACRGMEILMVCGDYRHAGMM